MSGTGQSGPPGPAMALDLGERRIGVALSDRRRILASPLTVVVRTGDRAREHEEIRRLVEEAGATTVVIGLPLSLSGASGPAANRAMAEIEELRALLPVPVVAQDERLSTVEAERRLRDTSARRNSRAPAKKRRAVVDDKAAAIVLESFLASGPRP
jgi:putative Holliday junction resolvase